MYKFQYYPADIKKCKPIGFTTIEELIKLHKNPSKNMIKVFEDIAKAENNNNMKLKAKLKQNNLLYFTPCVHIRNWRKYDNIITFTGLLVLDFDHIENAEAFKNYLFNQYPFIVSAWLSPSKRGVKAIVKIPVIKIQSPINSSVDEFKDYFRAISDIMINYDGFDEINKNPAQPLFQSYDPNLLFRNDSIIFNEKKLKKVFIPKPSVQPFRKFDSNDRKEQIVRMTKRKMGEIITNGHPQLLKIAFTLGGYVGGGYLYYNEAESLIFSLIDQNEYLSKDISGYKKTAKGCIKDGIEKPLYFTY